MPGSCRIIYSISSRLGSKKARRWHASRKLISLHAFHHSHIREKRWLSLSRVTPSLPPSFHPLYAACLCQYLTGTFFFVQSPDYSSQVCSCCLGVSPFVTAVKDVCISLATELAAHTSSSSSAIRAKMLTCLSSMIISYS